jgi:ERCC4-type nuclease
MLGLGDYAFAICEEARPEESRLLLDLIVERKQLADLVQRSSAGTHMNQILRMELSLLRNCFLLLEGKQTAASTIEVFDPHLDPDLRTTIASGSDVDRLVSTLIVHGGKVRLLQTRDSEVTSRCLAHLTLCAAVQAKRKWDSHEELGLPYSDLSVYGSRERLEAS